MSGVGMIFLKKNRRGFSLLELLIVLAVTMVVSVIAVPRFVSYMSMYRLRSGMSQASGFLQQVRMQAIRLNTTLTLSTGTDNGEGVAWVNLPGGTANRDPGEPMVQLPRSVRVSPYGYPGDASAGLFAAEPQSTPISFNARGLPCVVTSSSTQCQNFDSDRNQQVGFVIYFRNAGFFGAPNWGAVTIAPAGHVRTSIWNGSSYSGQ